MGERFACNRCAVARVACKHCGWMMANPRPRGLCHKCYNLPHVRRQHKAKQGGWPEDDSTDEELNRLIEEQSRPERLPRWWPKNGQRDTEE